MRLPLPTALGWKAIAFYVVLVGAFYASSYANLFFLLIAFLTVLGVLNVLWTLHNLAGGSALVEEIAECPAGAGGVLRVRVDTGGRTRFALEAELEVEEHGWVRARGGVVEDESTLRGAIPPLPRGLYTVWRARLSSTWPLGLLRARLPIDPPKEIVVYPVPADFDVETGGGAGLEEICAQLGVAGGFLQPSGLREHRPGDGLRSVHWKASARRGSLVVKEWEGGAGAGSEIVLDRRCGRGQLEEALSILTAAALAARDQKEPLRIKSQGFDSTFGPGQRPWRELLRFLACAGVVSPSGPPPPSASPSVPRLPLRRGA